MSETKGSKGPSSRDPSEEVRVHQPRRALPTDVVRPTRAEVHLSALRHNLKVLRQAAPETPVWAVLKADAYGHGAKAVGRTLERAGADGICVALVEEGVELREAGIRLPILVMGGYYGRAERELSHFRLTPVLSDKEQASALSEALRHEGIVMKVHVKVDTGMARLGTRKEGWPDLIEALAQHDLLEVEGLMTHLAKANVAEEGVLEEPLRLFEEAYQAFQKVGLSPPIRHMANSAALLRDPATHFQRVRPGIALFGVDPLQALSADQKTVSSQADSLRPTLSVHSRIVSLRSLRRGDAAGYGGAFSASRETKIATVPMGYADGLSRLASNRASVLVRGKRAPIAGNVSMDMTMIDVTDIEGVQVGDEVVILGAQKGPLGEDQITTQELAAWTDSIPYEVLTNLSRRVPRFYREA